jgi:hypothetical protein
MSPKDFKKGVIIVLKDQIFVYALKRNTDLSSRLELLGPNPLPKSLKIYIKLILKRNTDSSSRLELLGPNPLPKSQ